MELFEQLVLTAIIAGNTNLKSISFFLDLSPDDALTVVKSCEKQKLIRIDSGQIYLTDLGLFRASEYCDNDQVICEFDREKPYFIFQNNLNKDVLFFPYLFFDTIYNQVDDYKYKIYKTEIKKEINAGLDILKAIENYMDTGLTEKGAIWILKTDKISFCGFGINYLEKTLKDTGYSDAEIKFAFSENAYILIITAKMTAGIIRELSFKFYLSNCGEAPYLDTLKFLEKRLRAVLTFIGEKEIPRGREIIIERLNLTKSDKTIVSAINETGFVPKPIGKYLFTGDGGIEIDKMPLIIVLSSETFKDVPYLGKVSPWFVTCSGGFIEKDFTESRRFLFRRLENYILDEELVWSLTLDLWPDVGFGTKEPMDEIDDTI